MWGWPGTTWGVCGGGGVGGDEGGGGGAPAVFQRVPAAFLLSDDGRDGVGDAGGGDGDGDAWGQRGAGGVVADADRDGGGGAVGHPRGRTHGRRRPRPQNHRLTVGQEPR